MEMGRAIQAIMAQAPQMMATYKADLAARGLGFSADDLTAVAASAAAHPNPPVSDDPAADAAAMQRAQEMAMAAVYPVTGFEATDPRLAPVGMSLPAYAVAAKAVGWANGDDALIERVCAALGITRGDYDQAGAHWSEILKTDMPVATLYGQLYGAAAELPARPSASGPGPRLRAPRRP
jgi:hypothetical protein